MVPTELLQRFLQSCTRELDECSLHSAQPIASIRKHVLQQQRACLARVLETYQTSDFSVDQVQAVLRELGTSSSSSSLQKDLDAMDEAARQSVCRLVLYSQCHADEDMHASLISSGVMERSDILEFCGLCQTAVRLEIVQKHLCDGSPLFDDSDDSGTDSASEATIFPQKRLETIQRHFLRALGYDPDHGTREIQRIFFSGQQSEYADDEMLMETFRTLVSTMNSALTNATLHAQQRAFSDQDDGGVTRVVSVNYSEKLVDAASGEDVVEAAVPSGQQRMEQQAEAQQQARLSVAREAAALQQEMLGELLALRDEERESKLAHAKQVTNDALRQAMELPAGAERIVFLRSMDAETQRLMAMHKLWEGVVASNGGREPVIHHQSNAAL